MHPRTTTRAPERVTSARYSDAAARATSFSVQPSSASGTKRGQAVCVTARPGSSARIAWPYASETTVASVARTAMGGTHAGGIGRSRGRDRRLGAGGHDAHDGHRRHLLDHVERERRCRVARDDDRLHVLVEQESDRAARVAAHRFGRLRAVRKARRVAEVEEVLEGHAPRHRLEHREAADAGVEEADRPRVAHVRSAVSRRRGRARRGRRGNGAGTGRGGRAGA